MIETDCPQSPGTSACVDALPVFFQTGLQVRDVMNKTQFVVSGDTPILTVAQIMMTHHMSTVAIEESGRMVAVITEREIARGAARHGSALRDMRASDIMAPLPTGIRPECPLSEAAQIMRAHRLRWFPVIAGQDVISILTQADMTRGATLLPELGDAGSIMSTEIITIDAGSPLLDAARIMTERDISCLIATHQGKVGGILTEADILRQLAENSSSWLTIIVADVMTFPVISIEPTYSLSEARAVMDRTRVHRLVVMDQGRPCGLITQTDITRALDRRLRGQEQRRWRRLPNSNDAIFAVDLSKNTIFVNATFARLFGSSDPEVFLGQPFLPLCCWENPADREPFMTALENRDLQAQDARLKTSSGRILPVVLFSTIAKNFRGEVIGRQGIVHLVGSPCA